MYPSFKCILMYRRIHIVITYFLCVLNNQQLSCTRFVIFAVVEFFMFAIVSDKVELLIPYQWNYK